jgi:hypothetical protein
VDILPLAGMVGQMVTPLARLVRLGRVVLVAAAVAVVPYQAYSFLVVAAAEELGCWALARQARVVQRAVLVVEEGAALAEQQEAQRAGAD